MSLSHYYVVDNGGRDEFIPVWDCNECGGKIDGSWPHRHIKTSHFCMECAFKIGLITEKEYYGGKIPKDHHLEIINGEVMEWVGKRSPFNRVDSDYRKTKEYKDWRSSVFLRDKHTCLDCGKVGGKIEAHHIKKFKDYPSERFEVWNGETLCRPCHMKKHSRCCNG